MTAGEGAAPCSPSARAGAEARSGDLEVDAGERACACSQRCAEATAAVGWWVGGGGGGITCCPHLPLVDSQLGRQVANSGGGSWLASEAPGSTGRQAGND